MVGVVLPSLEEIMNADDETTKHKEWFHHTGRCHSSKRKHGECALVCLALKHTLAIISDVVA